MSYAKNRKANNPGARIHTGTTARLDALGALYNLKFGGKPVLIWPCIEPPPHRYGVPGDDAFAVPVTFL